jgi:hypothetical protein
MKKVKIQIFPKFNLFFVRQLADEFCDFCLKNSNFENKSLLHALIIIFVPGKTSH